MVIRFKEAFGDLREATLKWRVWMILSVSEVRSRYLRSALGQFWITISTMTLIVALGFVWSFLFRMPVGEYLPWVAVSIILWNYMAASIADGVGCYSQTRSYLMELYLPKSVPFFYSMTKNLSVFLHNVILIPVVLIVFQMDIGLSIFLAVPGMLLLMGFLFGLSMLTGPLGARYGDFHNVVGVGVQILFYVTPVIWKSKVIADERVRAILEANPVGILLDLVRLPILGEPVSAAKFGIGAAFVAVVMGCGFFTFAMSRRRVGYWL